MTEQAPIKRVVYDTTRQYPYLTETVLIEWGPLLFSIIEVSGLKAAAIYAIAMGLLKRHTHVRQFKVADIAEKARIPEDEANTLLERLVRSGYLAKLEDPYGICYAMTDQAGLRTIQEQ